VDSIPTGGKGNFALTSNYFPMITLNIGLNNNPFTFIETVSFFEFSGLTQFEFRWGIYDGHREPTAVLQLSELPDVELLCKFFTQECIAVLDESTGIGSLIYNPDYQGDRHQFDFEYFLEFKNPAKVN
jgi:hypothetical protein